MAIFHAFCDAKTCIDEQHLVPAPTAIAPCTILHALYKGNAYYCERP